MNNTTPLQAVIFDFHGVLCHDLFYSNIKEKYPNVHDFISTKIFGKGSLIPNEWMKGEYTYNQINKIISDNTGIELETLNDLLIESIHNMRIDQQIIDIAKSIKNSGIPIALVTDNMDTFSNLTISSKGLDKIFPVIINSSEYGIMKQDEGGKLFDIALKKLGVSDYQSTLLIDDSIKSCEIFKSKGGQIHQFKNIENLNPIINQIMNDQIISKTISFVQDTLKDAEGGHDWFHIYRVWKLSENIASHECADMLVVQLGALLHDIADSKFHGGDEEIGPLKAKEFLISIGVENNIITHIENIIKNISFKGGKHEQTFKSIELDIIQDADRLDAIGAIGIARTFNYGGYKGRKLYDPTIPPTNYETSQQYKNSTAPTINHFYEKLLLLKDLMNTKTGKEMAESRHQFMLTFLDEFYDEWEGNK